MVKKYEKQLDVICMMGGDGTVIPIRIRFADEDGAVQVHTIKEYKDLSHRGTFTNPDGIFITNEMLVFLCKISNFGQEKRIMLYYDVSKSKWMMSA